MSTVFLFRGPPKGAPLYQGDEKKEVNNENKLVQICETENITANINFNQHYKKERKKKKK